MDVVQREVVDELSVNAALEQALQQLLVGGEAAELVENVQRRDDLKAVLVADAPRQRLYHQICDGVLARLFKLDLGGNVGEDVEPGLVEVGPGRIDAQQDEPQQRQVLGQDADVVLLEGNVSKYGCYL